MGVVINEVRVGGPGSGGGSNEFVEILNAGSGDVDIGGWRLILHNPGGSTPNLDVVLATVPNGTILRPGQFFLFAGSGYAGVPAGDVVYQAQLSTDRDYLGLRDRSGALIDSMGYGYDFGRPNEFIEGTAFTVAPTTTQSIERFPTGNDTNDNANDFRLTSNPSPTNLQSDTPVPWRASQTVNATTAGTQSRPHVTQLTNGNIVVVWATSELNGTAFLARLFDPAGNPIGGELFRQYLTPDDNFTFPDVVAGANGTFVTSYMDGNTTSIFVNTWDSSGNPAGASPAVLDSAGSNPDYANPVVAFANSNPNRVLLVAEQLSPAGSIIVGRLRTTAGGDVAGALSTLFDFAGGVVDPAVASLTFNGNFVIAATHLQAGDSRIVYRVISGTTGAAIAGPFEITGTGGNGRTDSEASVSALAGGGFVIAWRSSNGTDSNIEYRTYSSAGSQNAAGSIGARANDNLHDPTVIPLADGSFIIAYDDDLSLAQQAAHISAAGVLLGTFAYGGNGGGGDATGLADGRFATVWIDATGEISLEILDTRDGANARIGEGVVAGTIGNDVLTADFGRTYGGPGDDEITLELDYDDSPFADGGDGTDTLVLSGQTYTVEVDLAAGTVEVLYVSGPNVFYVTQSARNFENIRYSGIADLEVRGTGGANFIVAGSGDDTLLGFGGDDGFSFGASFTAADRVDGGDGTNDQIGLRGDYTGLNALVLGTNTITNVEVIAVLPGFDYNVTTVDANVPGTTRLTIFGGNLGAGDNLTFNGAAETTGSFKVYGGRGIDHIATGGGNDAIYFGPGKFNPAADQVNGGSGANDQLALDGDYAMTLTGTAIQNIDVIALLKGIPGDFADYDLTLDASLLGAGQAMTIWGVTLQTDLTVDGSAVAGNLTLYGGAFSDRLSGGSGSDWFWGGADADNLNGGGGADTFVYDSVLQSRATGFAFDTLIDFDDRVDKIDLPNAVTSFAGPTSGRANAATFGADLEGANTLFGLGQAVVFTATGGDMDTRVFLLVNANGATGYQAAGDFLIELVTPVSPVDQVGMFI